MEPRSVIEEGLKNARMMQIATVNGDQPWNCTVYFASDDKMNLYWISLRESRHSKELESHPKVGVAIPLKFDDFKVRGLSIEGEAALVKDKEEIKYGVTLYCNKFNRGDEWLSDFFAGKIPFVVYRIKPKVIVLTDRVNFPDNERQEYKLES